MEKSFNQLANQYYDEIVKTASEMLQIPSVSGNEKDFGEYTIKKMKELKYDEVVVDKVGNVIGIMRGTGGGKSTMLYCHMDTVEEGNFDMWKYPPFSGKIAEGKIWGRGASDTKGTFAHMIYTPYILKEEGIMPKGDIYVVGVVQEETAGFGAMHMAMDEKYLTDFAVVGEATENDIAVACKGRICIEITITGRSCHASIPETGVNPFDYLYKFLEALKHYPLEYDENFGTSKITPTKVVSSEIGTNIVPHSIVLTLDYRSVPSETNESILEKVQKVIDSCLFKGIAVDMKIVMVDVTTYNGFKGEGIQGLPAFLIDKEHEAVVTAKKALEDIFNREVRLKPWAFGTDSGHYASKGVAVIGYSPAEIKYCHTAQDNMDLEMLREGIAGCLAIAESLSNLPQ